MECIKMRIERIIENLDIDSLMEWIDSGGDVNKHINCLEGTMTLIELVLCEIDGDKNGEIICEMLNLLIEHGADVNDYGSGNIPPLFISVAEECMSATQILLKAGADVDLRNCEGMTPLIQTVINENVELLNILLKYSNSEVINKWGSYWGATPLGIAFYKLNIPIIELLLKHGADPYIRDGDLLSTISHIPSDVEIGTKGEIDKLIEKYYIKNVKV